MEWSLLTQTCNVPPAGKSSAAGAVESNNTDMTSSEGTLQRRQFDAAFALAYFIHVNKDVAFFIAEDAVDELGSMLGYQNRHRKSSEVLRGFLKWGERSRPIRKTTILSERQMLQWLVYRQSQSWEEDTERAVGLYLPTEEDLIVRYIEHLVFISLRRGSFYVTLAIVALLHQFKRRETRLFYDILTQSDPARMKDTAYIGKQRLDMLERVARRFEPLVQLTKKSGEEKLFVMRPATEWVRNLVGESLKRFAPWDTTCKLAQSFDVTDIPGFYFSGTGDSDEELIEMNRIHTLLEPQCFALFTKGLANYVQTLPREDQDKACNYESSDERLAVPQFSSVPTSDPRGNRFQTPTLNEEDYVRLQRTLKARRQRRTHFMPQQIRIYLDDSGLCSFDAHQVKSPPCLISSASEVVAVKGVEGGDEVTLGTLILGGELFNEPFTDTLRLPNGVRLTVSLIPIEETNGGTGTARLHVSYGEMGFVRLVRQRFVPTLSKEVSDQTLPRSKGNLRWVSVAAVVALLLSTSVFLWWRFANQRGEPEQQILGRIAAPAGDKQAGTERPPALPTPSPIAGTPPAAKPAKSTVPRARWSTDRSAMLAAIPVEPTRSETQSLDVSRRQETVFLSVPRYSEEGQEYSSYRVTVSAAGAVWWTQTLPAPRRRLTDYANILALSMTSSRSDSREKYKVRIEGHLRTQWVQIGELLLQTK